MWRNRHPYFNAEGGGSGGSDDAGKATDPAAAGGGASADGAGGAAAAEGWFGKLPEGYRNDPSVAKFAGRPLDDLVASYVNAAKLIGVQPENVLRLDEAAKDPAAVLRRLGAPEKPDGYKLAPPEGVPEHLASGENLNWFKTIAAEAGLLPGQAEKLYTAYVAKNVEVQKALDGAIDAARDTLQREWGAAYEGNIKAASAAARALGLTEKLNDAGLGADPAVVKALVEVNRLLAGRGDDAPGGRAEGGTLPPNEARAKGKELTRQAHKAHQDGNREEAARLRNEASRYYKMAAA